MAGKNSGTAKAATQKIAGGGKRRTLPDMMDVLDSTLTGVLNDTVDARKANCVAGVVGKWMGGVNTMIRAHKIALPTEIKKVAGLPEPKPEPAASAVE